MKREVKRECKIEGCPCDGKRNHFPGYPDLKRIAMNSRTGERMELLEVNRTSDGYLIGYARFGEGEHAYEHSVFIG